MLQMFFHETELPLLPMLIGSLLKPYLFTNFYTPTIQINYNFERKKKYEFHMTQTQLPYISYCILKRPVLDE